MNSLKNIIISFLFTSLVLSSAPILAAGFLVNKDILWQGNPNEYFKYADQDKTSFGKNDHPVELEEKAIHTVLGTLRISGDTQTSSKEELKSVFTVQQTNMLGQYLAKGLKNATQDQDIIFAMERPVKQTIGFKANRYFVAGRAFYKDGKLNVIIGDYERPSDDGYEAAVDPTHVGIVRYHFDHGKRSKSSRFNKVIVSTDGVENKRLKNIQRGDWLVIDVASATKAYDQLQTIRKKEEMAKKRKELKEILGSEEPASSEKAIPNEQTDQLRKATDSLEERLTTLKRLREKELITDEEYAQKRKQMLDEL